MFSNVLFPFKNKFEEKGEIWLEKEKEGRVWKLEYAHFFSAELYSDKSFTYELT